MQIRSDLKCVLALVLLMGGVAGRAEVETNAAPAKPTAATTADVSLEPRDESRFGRRGEFSRPLTELERTVRAVQMEFVPDRHLAIFNITATNIDDKIIVEGDVDNPAAKEALLKRLQSPGKTVVADIKILPDPALGEEQWGIIAISGANVREEPKPGGELGTQVLMGHTIKLLKSGRRWYYVQSEEHYPGWIEDGDFVHVTKARLDAWQALPKVIVTNLLEGRMWEKPSETSQTVSDVVPGDLLHLQGEEGDFYKVGLPDGRGGYLAKKLAMPLEAWKKARRPTPEGIERVARTYLGSPYLWGGTTVKAMDCSGFTKTVFGVNGIDLLRNASHQSREGQAVPLDADLSQLRKGDLLFFGNRGEGEGQERVSHVGIYLGDKLFIHSSGRVRINSLDPNSPLLDEHRRQGLVKVRRYLPNAAN